MDRAWWIAQARDHIARWDALPTRDRRFMPAPAPLRVPPAELLELLGEEPDGQGALL